MRYAKCWYFTTKINMDVFCMDKEVDWDSYNKL